MVATTSLGMGINIPDIKIVVNWKFPIGDSVSEAWQRAGRGGRAKGMVSEAYFFFPYWAFDSEGRNDPLRPAPAPVAPPPIQKKPARRRKNTLPSLSKGHKPKSSLRNSVNASETGSQEPESSINQMQVQEEEDGQSSLVPGTFSASTISEPEDTRPFWSQQDLARREALAPVWKELCNAPCKRKPILRRLGEGRLHRDTERVECLPTECCTGCNPDLAPTITKPPGTSATATAPSAGSKAGFAHALLCEWATQQGDVMYNHPNRRFHIPSTVILPRELGWQLARLYTAGAGVKPLNFFPTLDLETLLSEVPALRKGQYLQRLGVDLVQKMKLWRKEVQDKMDEKNGVARAQSQEVLASTTEQSTFHGPAKRGGRLFHSVADQNATSRRITAEIQLSIKSYVQWLPGAPKLPPKLTPNNVHSSKDPTSSGIAVQASKPLRLFDLEWHPWSGFLAVRLGV